MTNNQLEGIDCPAANLCIAVGYAQTFFQTEGNFNGALALKGEESGGNWTWSTLSTDNSGGSLHGVSCPTSSHCLGVGTYSVPAKILLEEWGGGAGGIRVG